MAFGTDEQQQVIPGAILGTQLTEFESSLAPLVFARESRGAEQHATPAFARICCPAASLNCSQSRALMIPVDHSVHRSWDVCVIQGVVEGAGEFMF